ncbi:MAG: UDP-glycosyltransferase, partial [Winogradskyella sp.]
VDTNYYILWSDWMRRDMDLFYPEIKQEQLKIAGTPQFEFYTQNDRIINRATFAKRYGLNPESKWLCFSGDDEYTSPYDPTYLNDIAEAISKIDEPVQLIFRRCPVDFTTRYDAVLEAYKDIIISIDPIWHTDAKAWVGYFSKLEDVDLQVNLAKHCEAVINLGSTMALDFATFNKPCLYLNYDTVKDDNWSTEFIYRFHHFKSMEGLNAVGWLNSKSEIKATILAVLEADSTVGSDRKLWLKKLVLCPLEANANLIANTLQ